MKDWIKRLYSKYQKDIRSMSVFLVIIFAIRSSIICPYTVPTGSMEPTIKAGDRIFVNKMAYNLRIPFTQIPIFSFSPPKRGDIIAFKYPVDPSIDYIKRVIGVSGDKVVIENGVLFVNDQRVPLEPVTDRSDLEDISDPNRNIKEIYSEDLKEVKHIIITNPPIFSRRIDGTWKIPKDHFFVMGDNRDNSQDSRYWKYVPMEYIHGRALFVFFSFYWKEYVPQIRTDRFFSGLK